MHKLEKHKQKIDHQLWCVMAGVLAVLVLLSWAGVRAYVEREARYRHQVESTVKTSNEQMLLNVTKWRASTMASANALVDDSLFAQALVQWIRNPNGQAPLREHLLTRLRTMTERHDFAKIVFLNTQGEPLLVTQGALTEMPSEREHTALLQAMQQAQAVAIEPYALGAYSFPTLAVMAPVYDGMQPVGALWMVVDLRSTLFRMLDMTRQGSATAESMLVQLDGREVVHINPVRERSLGRGEVLRPAVRDDQVLAQAVSGVRGVFYDTDYRQRRVLAVSGVVPDSPWVLITKMDVAEAFADTQRKEGIYLGLLIGASALLVLSTLMYWMWRIGRREYVLKVALEKNMARLERAQKAASLGFFTIDFARKHIVLSPMAAQIVGVPGQSSLAFGAVKKYLPASELRRVLKALVRVRRFRTAQKMEFALYPHNGKTPTVECWCEVDESVQASRWPQLVGSVQDITQRKESDQVLEEYRTLLESQVRKDSLTGVANRRALDEALAREWQDALREQQPLAVLVIDIDYFKGYNDSYGHLQGDECLKQVAQLLTRHAQRPRDQVFRFGGEEFVVLLPQTSLAAAHEVGQQLCRNVQRQGIANRASPLWKVVTVSVGVASLTPQRGQSLQACPLLAMADTALYTAKNSGRNQAQAYSTLGVGEVLHTL